MCREMHANLPRKAANAGGVSTRGDNYCPGSASGLPPDAHPVLDLVGRRLVIGILTLCVVSVIVFLATEVLPGNAAYAVLGRSATPARLHALEAQLHLNRPMLDQYWTWMSGLFTGNLGTSWPTACRCGASSARACSTRPCWWPSPGFIGEHRRRDAGCGGRRAQGRLFDHASSVLALAVTSLPEFVVAIALIILFATVVWHVLPAVSLLAPGTYAWASPGCSICRWPRWSS